MIRATISGEARWSRAFLLCALGGALLFACVAAQLPPRAGLVDFTELTRVPVPTGHVNAAGGNFHHQRVDLSLETRLGPFAIGAVYDSASGWLASVDVTYKDQTLRDASGASLTLASLANGAAVPGTRWVKLDETQVKTKGGLVHEFDATTGRLLVQRYASASYPRLRFVQVRIGSQTRTRAVDQCTSATACTPLFTLAYDANARLVRVDDRAGRIALFTYDAAGKLASARDGLDVAKGWPGERYAYAGNFLAAITNSEGERVEITSDLAGRATEVRAIGAGDPSWRFSYGVGSATGIYTTTLTNPLGHVTSYAIDASLRLQSLTNPLGERTDFTWIGFRPGSRTLPDGTRTTWSWVNDDLASETTPAGNVRTFTYQAGATDRAQLDARPLLELRDSVSLVERRSYDANGRLASVTNGHAEETAFSYDASESLVRATLPDGTVLALSGYGEHGQPSFAVFGESPDGAVSSYDNVGNRIRSTMPDPESGGVKQRLYDADRNVATIEVLDAPGSGPLTSQPIRQEFRSDGQRLRTLRPYGGQTTFSYDALGRLIAIAEQVSPRASAQPSTESATTIARDALGRITAVEKANGMREEIEYDAAGRVSRRRTRMNGVLETDVAFEFAAGRLVRVSGADGFAEAFQYDAAGRIREVTHSLGEATRFLYDARSRPTQTSFVLANGAPLATLAHTYDFADRERTLSYLGADLIARRFIAGRLELTYYGNGVRQHQFRSTQSGRATGRELWRGNKRIEKSDYTLANVPGGELSRQRSVVNDGTSADGVTQEDFSYASLYGQNAMDRRVASARANASGVPIERITYDALSNYTGGAASPMAQALAYNAEHNRVLQATHPPYGIPFQPALTSTFEYDAAGYVSSESVAAGSLPSGTNAFSWNARGQLAAIHRDDVEIASFAYDALGRRRARTLGSATKRWRFGGVVEADAGDLPVALDLGEVRIDFGGSSRYRHADARGNPRHVTNAAGRVVRHNGYGAYGQTSALGTQPDDLGFARGTPIATPNASYVLIGARLYAPMLGRFLAPDPVWNAINQYSYTLGNPVDYWDPAGLHAGPHHDLIQAKIGVATAVLAVVASAAAIAAAPVLGPAGPLLGLNLSIALLQLTNAVIELNQQIELHEEASRRERMSTRENTGGGGAVSVGGGGGTGFTAGGPRTFEVCADDGMGSFCTSSGLSGWIQYPRVLLR